MRRADMPSRKSDYRKRQREQRIPPLPPRYNRRGLGTFLKAISVLTQEEVAELMGMSRDALIAEENKAIAKLLHGLEPIMDEVLLQIIK